MGSAASYWKPLVLLVIPFKSGTGSGKQEGQHKTVEQNQNYSGYNEKKFSEEDHVVSDEQLFGDGKSTSTPYKSQVGNSDGSNRPPGADELDERMARQRKRPPEGCATFIHEFQRNTVYETGLYPSRPPEIRNCPDISTQTSVPSAMVNGLSYSVSCDQTPSIVELQMSDSGPGRMLTSRNAMAPQSPILPGCTEYSRQEMHQGQKPPIGNMQPSVYMNVDPHTMSAPDMYELNKPTYSSFLQESDRNKTDASNESLYPIFTPKCETKIKHDKRMEESIKDALATEFHTTPKLFDAAVVYDKADYDEAVTFRDNVTEIVTRDLHERDVRVELFDSDQFAESQIYLVEDIITKCSVVFVYLTDNVRSRYFDFFVEEATALSRISGRLGDRYILRPVHTSPEERRRYRTPVGLMTTQGLDWYEKGTAYVKNKILGIMKNAINKRKGIQPNKSSQRSGKYQQVQQPTLQKGHRVKANVFDSFQRYQPNTSYGRENVTQATKMGSIFSQTPQRDQSSYHENPSFVEYRSPSVNVSDFEHVQQSTQNLQLQPQPSGQIDQPGSFNQSVHCPTGKLVSFASSNEPTHNGQNVGFPRFYDNAGQDTVYQQTYPTSIDRQQNTPPARNQSDQTARFNTSPNQTMNPQNHLHRWFSSGPGQNSSSPYLSNQVPDNTGHDPMSYRAYQINPNGEHSDAERIAFVYDRWQPRSDGHPHSSVGNMARELHPPFSPSTSPNVSYNGMGAAIPPIQQPPPLHPSIGWSSPGSYRRVPTNIGQRQHSYTAVTGSAMAHTSLDDHDTPPSTELQVVSKVTGRLIVTPNLSTDDVEIDTKNLPKSNEIRHQNILKQKPMDRRERNRCSSSLSSGGEYSSSDDDEVKLDLFRKPRKAMTKGQGHRRSTVVNITGNKILQIGDRNSVTESKRIVSRKPKREMKNIETVSERSTGTTKDQAETPSNKDKANIMVSMSSNKPTMKSTSDILANMDTDSPKSLGNRFKRSPLRQTCMLLDSGDKFGDNPPDDIPPHRELPNDMKRTFQDGTSRTIDMSKTGNSSYNIDNFNNHSNLHVEDGHSDTSTDDNSEVVPANIPVNMTTEQAKVSNNHTSPLNRSPLSDYEAAFPFENNIHIEERRRNKLVIPLDNQINVLCDIGHNYDSFDQFTSDSELFRDDSRSSYKESSSSVADSNTSSVSAVTRLIKEDDSVTVSMETELD